MIARTDLEILLPFLQDTAAFHKTMQGVGEKNHYLKAKLDFINGALTGIAEAVSYLALSVFYHLSSAPEDIKKHHQYFMLSQGAWAGLILSIIGIWDASFAAILPDKIEETCNERWNEWVKCSNTDLKMRLQKERKEIFESLRDEDFATRTRVMAKWDKRNKKLSQQVKEYVVKQKILYPSLKKQEKYPFLQNLKIVITTVR